jgi:DNA-directed RNA polymerase specialized sigma24 family protein
MRLVLPSRSVTRARHATAPLPARPARARIAAALRSCSAREQLALVLLLVERLTPAEAAVVLGLSTGQIERAYRAALADLRLALRGRRAGRTSRALARRSLALDQRLRRAA